jgi:hypothetical protein
MSVAPFSAVIFDCDGVIVDSVILGLRSLQQSLHEVGVERSLDSLLRFSGRNHHETLAEIEAESVMLLHDRGLVKRMDECYMDIVGAVGVHPCPGRATTAVMALSPWPPLVHGGEYSSAYGVQGSRRPSRILFAGMVRRGQSQRPISIL